MQRFSNTQRKVLTKEAKENLLLKQKITELEQTIMEINFSKAIVVKENEDKDYQVDKLKKEVDYLKKEKEAENERLKKENENEIQKIHQEFQSIVEDKTSQIEKLKRENEMVKREKDNEIIRIKEEYEKEQQNGQKQNVEFIYKLKSEFFSPTPYVENKLLEENREKLKKLEQEKQNLRQEIERISKTNSTVLRSKSNKKI
jgi:hypothetical protein